VANKIDQIKSSCWLVAYLGFYEVEERIFIQKDTSVSSIKECMQYSRMHATFKMRLEHARAFLVCIPLICQSCTYAI